MALQFFAVHSEALAFTHDALQAHAQALGQRSPGPTRALRVAQLYGHLQLRAAGRAVVTLALCELATRWRLQPRQLRQDLALLQALGWLTANGTSRGTVIALHPPEPPPEPPIVQASLPGLGVEGAEAWLLAQASAPPDASLSAPHSAAMVKPEPTCSLDPAPESSGFCDTRAATTAVPAKATAPKRGGTGETELLQRLAALYNQHRPPTWPAYQPRGNSLRGKVRQALRHAGSAEALAAAFTAALAAMPPFWRHTYPVGRSGAECMAVLFATDRGCAGLGVEFWHLFSWAQAGAQAAQPSPPAAAANGSAPPVEAEDPLTRARRLFLWDSGVWRGQGREALLLSLAEKRELTLLLEANGDGVPGTAARQFAELEPLGSVAAGAQPMPSEDPPTGSPPQGLPPAGPGRTAPRKAAPPPPPHRGRPSRVEPLSKPVPGQTPRHPPSPVAGGSPERTQQRRRPPPRPLQTRPLPSARAS